MQVRSSRWCVTVFGKAQDCGGVTRQSMARRMSARHRSRRPQPGVDLPQARMVNNNGRGFSTQEHSQAFRVVGRKGGWSSYIFCQQADIASERRRSDTRNGSKGQVGGDEGRAGGKGSICRSRTKVACRHPLTQAGLAGNRRYV